MRVAVRDASYDSNGIQVSWDPATRIVQLIYEPRTRAGREQAHEVQAWIDERVGKVGTFFFLIDVAGADDAGAAWRFPWVSWFYGHRARMHVAIFHAERVGRTIVDAFRLSTRTQVRSFGHEAEARRWLAAVGEDQRAAARSL